MMDQLSFCKELYVCICEIGWEEFFFEEMICYGFWLEGEEMFLDFVDEIQCCGELE